MICRQNSQVFVGAHYAGDDLIPKFGQGEPWKKVFGPVFIYLNTVAGEEDPLMLWDDAKRQVRDGEKTRKILSIFSHPLDMSACTKHYIELCFVFHFESDDGRGEQLALQFSIIRGFSKIKSTRKCIWTIASS